MKNFSQIFVLLPTFIGLTFNCILIEEINPNPSQTITPNNEVKQNYSIDNSVSPIPKVSSSLNSSINTTAPTIMPLVINNPKYSLPKYFPLQISLSDENEKIETLIDRKISIIGKILTPDMTFRDSNSSMLSVNTTKTVAEIYMPNNILVEFTVQGTGLTIRKQIIKFHYGTGESIKHLHFGGPCTDTDSICFGVYGGSKYFISERPETTPLTPTYDSKDIPLNTQIKLSFSEPVETKSVEENLIIKVINPGITSLKKDETILFGSDYTTKWNEDNTGVTFTPKDGKLLTTGETPPKYAIAFKELFKDKDGNLSNDIQGHFRVEPDNYMKSVFTVVSSSPSPAPYPSPSK